MSTSFVSPALSPATYIGARFSPDKVSFPVRSTVPYAHFEHVRGVPPTAEGNGYSINRLHILNAILGRHANLESRSAEAIELSGEDISIDRITENAEKLQEAAARSVYGASYGNGLFETGVGFSVEG